MSGDDCVSVHLTIRGRVQGVGYREWLRRQAVAQGLCGWVRNRRDGTVEAELTGPAEAIDRVAATCRQGPALAEVHAVEAAACAAAEPVAAGFEIRPTR
ncbi:MAG TPA: acylphosphatase [Xanthobacteraceae bacterium]|nr:acylphosphatase [Xanthobacteraceae bacterium]